MSNDGMDPTTEAAVITLTNTTGGTIQITAVLGGASHKIATLAEGESTTQVTPSGVSWVFGKVGSSSAESTLLVDDEEDEDEAPPSVDGPTKGGLKGVHRSGAGLQR